MELEIFWGFITLIGITMAIKYRAPFKQFIGPEMKLLPVKVDNHHSVPHLLRFYMGKNTPERRSYIMEQLVVDEST